MKNAAIIQARMGSTRLPGKVMMKIDKRNPVLYYVIKQLQNSKYLSKIVVATTGIQEDDIVVEFVNEMDIDYFRGSSTDVLDRYYKCAKKFSLSSIVRITADNPLIDPLIVDKVIEKFNSDSYDYVTNTQPRTFPQGTETEMFSFQALEKAWCEAKKPSEREHVTPYFYNNPSKFRIFNVTHSEDLSHLRWTVDRESDLNLIKNIVTKIKKRPILTSDIINLITKNPDLLNINKDYAFNEGYLKSLKDDKEFFKSGDN